jgi:dTDP-4-amino-4,6-dideoxygalactose transaminase
LPHLAAWNGKRREHAHLYNELLKGAPVVLPTEQAGNTPVYHLYVVSTSKRDELQAYLKEQGIFTGIHYPIPVHLQKAMEFLGYKRGDFPVTEQAVSQILSLPMYAELLDDEIKYVTEAISAFFKKNS